MNCSGIIRTIDYSTQLQRLVIYMEIIDMLTYFKTKKISKATFEGELDRLFSAFSNASVLLDDTVNSGATNASYIANIVPENKNGSIHNTLVIDSFTLQNKLSAGDLQCIITAAQKFLPTSTKLLYNFIRQRGGTETGFNECILLYLNIYELFIDSIANTPTILELKQSKTIDLAKLNDVKLAIDRGTETHNSIVEFIQVNKIIPTFALNKAEDLYKEINLPITNTADGNKPTANYWYAKLISQITGNFNPEERKDIDPFYLMESSESEQPVAQPDNKINNTNIASDTDDNNNQSSTMSENTYNLIFNKIKRYAPHGWDKVVFHAKYIPGSYSMNFYFKKGNKYFDSYSLVRNNLNLMNSCFSEINNIILPERKALPPKDRWTVMTLTVDKNGKFKTNFDYSDHTDKELTWQDDWKKTYLN